MPLEQYVDTWWLPTGQLAACALVKVYPYDSNIPASIYANSCGSQKLPNPLRTSDRGELRFWAEPGKYWLHIDGRTHPITVGEQQCVTQQDVDQTMAGHVQSADPHGDRAAAQAALGHHAASTQNVHGLLDTRNLATKDAVSTAAHDALAQACAMAEEKTACHAAQTRNVHGICDTAALETVDGAQQKANEAVDAALLMARQAVEEHAARTTGVHGIADTSRLLTLDGVRPVIEQVLKDSGCCDGDGGGGTPTPDPEPGGKWETPEGAQRKADAAQKAAEAHAHGELTRAVEELRKEIPDGDGGGGKPTPDPEPGGKWETPEGAQAKADAAQKAAEAAAKKCCASTAQQAADDLDAAVKKLEKKIGDGGGGTPTPDPEPGGKWETPEGAKKTAEKVVQDALTAHVKSCHTLRKTTKGVTAEKGWEVDVAELADVGGVRTVFLRLKRTGAFIYSKDGDFRADGKPSQGNIVPDLLIAHVPAGWRPSQTLLVGGSTSYTDGFVRIHPNGDVYLLTTTYNNPIRTDHTFRFCYTFLTKPKCSDGATPGPGEEPKPDDGGGQPKPAPGAIDPQELAEALKQHYPSAYERAKAPVTAAADAEAEAWAAEDEQLTLTLRVPPSRKVRVAMSMRASSTVKELSQSHQAVEVKKGSDVVLEAEKAPLLTLSHARLNETLTCSRAFHVDFAEVGDGAVEAGDEVTFTVMNKVTLGRVQVLDRDISVESLMA